MESVVRARGRRRLAELEETRNTIDDDDDEDSSTDDWGDGATDGGTSHRGGACVSPEGGDCGGEVVTMDDTMMRHETRSHRQMQTSRHKRREEIVLTEGVGALDAELDEYEELHHPNRAEHHHHHHNHSQVPTKQSSRGAGMLTGATSYASVASAVSPPSLTSRAVSRRHRAPGGGGAAPFKAKSTLSAAVEDFVNREVGSGIPPKSDSFNSVMPGGILGGARRGNSEDMSLASTAFINSRSVSSITTARGQNSVQSAGRGSFEGREAGGSVNAGGGAGGPTYSRQTSATGDAGGARRVVTVVSSSDLQQYRTDGAPLNRQEQGGDGGESSASGSAEAPPAPAPQQTTGGAGGGEETPE